MSSVELSKKVSKTDAPKENPSDSADVSEDDYEFELYKSLRQEESSYVDKFSALWLQKIITMGVMLAFLVTNRTHIATIDKTAVTTVPILTIAAIACIPVVSTLLDTKMCEYSLQARIISRFLVGRFCNTDKRSTLRNWECLLWGEDVTKEDSYSGESLDLKLARLRCFLTVLVSAIPTLGLIAIATGTICALAGRQWWPLTIALGTVYIVAYTITAVYMWCNIFSWGSKFRVSKVADN